MATLDAHLVALDMKTGKVVWDIEIADYRQGYASTPARRSSSRTRSSSGIAGGEFAIRGFLDAYDVTTGTRAWRFWTVPAPGEPGSDTWPTEHRGNAAARRRGCPDRTTPSCNTVYWGTGNPNPDFYGDDRKGDNLYSGSLARARCRHGHAEVAFPVHAARHRTTGTRTRFPCSPTSPSAASRAKSVMVANRNGFLYVLDRVTGKFIHAKPFVHQTWAKEIGADGRPVELPDQRPTAKGTLTCPDLFGGTNFMSPSFDPATRPALRVGARDLPDLLRRSAARGLQGRRSRHGRPLARAPDTTPYGALRAIDPLTGERKWEIKHPTPSWAGVLTTAGGVVFSGDQRRRASSLPTRDPARSCCDIRLGAPIYAPPTTYMIDGRQYVGDARRHDADGVRPADADNDSVGRVVLRRRKVSRRARGGP